MAQNRRHAIWEDTYSETCWLGLWGSPIWQVFG